MSGRFATLTFKRKVPAPVSVLWQALDAPTEPVFGAVKRLSYAI